VNHRHVVVPPCDQDLVVREADLATGGRRVHLPDIDGQTEGCEVGPEEEEFDGRGSIRLGRIAGTAGDSEDPD